MSEGRGFAILEAVPFGVSSIAILVLTWTRPMPGTERVLSTLIGGLGAVIALMKARRFWIGRESLVEVAAKDKS